MFDKNPLILTGIVNKNYRLLVEMLYRWKEPKNQDFSKQELQGDCLVDYLSSLQDDYEGQRLLAEMCENKSKAEFY